MVPTLGSQEGAFENVKANFSGEQVELNLFTISSDKTMQFKIFNYIFLLIVIIFIILTLI